MATIAKPVIPGMVYYQDQTPFAQEKANRSGYYPRDIVQDIAGRAVSAGVDPHQALAIAMQETNLGTGGYRKGWIDPNPFQVDWQQHGIKHTREALMNKAFELMQRNKQRFGNTPKAIQAFEGFGTISEKGNKWYGRKEKFAPWKTGDYIKRVQAFMKDFRQNPEMREIVNRAQVAYLRWEGNF